MAGGDHSMTGRDRGSPHACHMYISKSGDGTLNSDRPFAGDALGALTAVEQFDEQVDRCP